MARDRIDRDELASKLMEASSAEDRLRAMAELITDFLMEAEVTAKVGAEPHERSAERTTHRNGHRDRPRDTRLGTLTRLCAELHRASAAQRTSPDQRDSGGGERRLDAQDRSGAARWVTSASRIIRNVNKYRQTSETADWTKSDVEVDREGIIESRDRECRPLKRARGQIRGELAARALRCDQSNGTGYAR